MTTATALPTEEPTAVPTDLTPVRHQFDLAHPRGVVQPAELDDPDYLIRVLWDGETVSTLEWPDECEVITP